MDTNLGDTESYSYARNRRCTSKLLNALILHHGQKETKIADDAQVELLVASLPKQPKEPWFMVLEDITPKPQHPLIVDIQRHVAKHYGVTRVDMISPRRTDNIVKPRQMAMYLSKEFTTRSLPEIGRKFGGRDHTTVIHAIRKIRTLAWKDWTIAHDVALLEAHFQ